MSKAIQFRNRSNEKIYPCPYFPIGSIYLSLNATNPSTYFGGTWELIKDRFLIGAGNNYAVNSTGGSKAHNHGFRVGYYPYYGGIIGNDDRGIVAYDYSSGKWVYGSKDNGMPDSELGNSGIQSSSKDINSAKYSVYGKTTITEVLPPYIAVYMWRRVS